MNQNDMMTKTYRIKGMSCMGCRTTVENALRGVHGVQDLDISIEEGTAKLTMKHDIPFETLEAAMKHTHYQIKEDLDTAEREDSVNKVTGNGIFYCPMQCEGEKTYAQPGDCPVCGMDLVEQVSRISKNKKYTCPMHPEVVNDQLGACPKCGMDLVEMEVSEGENKTYRELKCKFFVALAFTLPIFLIAMSEMIPGNPLYQWMPMSFWNWVQFLLSIPVLFYATWMFFIRAYNSVKSWNLNMFTLIGLGAGVAFIFSVIALIFPDIFPEQFKTEAGTVFVYFEAATVIMTLVLLGQMLEARAHGKTNSAIKELMKLAPSTAVRMKGENEEIIEVEEIQIGDIIKVKPGEKIPVDGIILKGESTLDESMISGEPIPIHKVEGDEVVSGTINGNRVILMKAERVGSETLLSQIIEMVNKASRSKAPIQKIADKISSYFVPVVVGISVLTFIVWAILGPEPKLVYAFVNAIAVLIIACPCALGLATPMSVMVGVGKGAQNGILIKNAEALERLHEIDTVIVDKTGTLTQGNPQVEQVVSFLDETTIEDVSELIFSVNKNSEHPLAQATTKYGLDKELKSYTVENFESITGKGVKALINGDQIHLGNRELLNNLGITLDKEQEERIQSFQNQGKTVPILCVNDRAVGIVVISDPIKASSKSAVKSLHQEGVHVIMLTGDNENTASAVASELGIQEFHANQLPQDKMRMISDLQQKGKKVAMAGDGINDAPALAKSDVGIAMGTGTDVAIESASVTLVNGDLKGVAMAKRLSDTVMKNIRQNLFFALIYNVMGVPIAAGILFPIFGWLLSPMIAALAMSFSSVSVIGNALRLRSFKI